MICSIDSRLKMEKLINKLNVAAIGEIGSESF